MKKVIVLSICIFMNTIINAQNSKLEGIYKCSNEDIIALYGNGTGKLSISYYYDGILNFRWSYNSSDRAVKIDLMLNDEQKYMILNPHLYLPYSERNYRQILSHATSGPTYLYIKQ